MRTATHRNARNCLSQDSVASKKTWAFSNTAVIHYSAHVVLIESVLVVIIRRRIKVLFITRPVVCLVNDVWRSTNLVHVCEAQIYVNASVVTREMSAAELRSTCEDGDALWLIKRKGIRMFFDVGSRWSGSFPSALQLG